MSDNGKWSAERHRAAKERCEARAWVAMPAQILKQRDGGTHVSGFSVVVDWADHSVGYFAVRQDAEWYAESCTDLPAALAEIERLQAVVSHMETVIKTSKTPVMIVPAEIMAVFEAAKGASIYYYDDKAITRCSVCDVREGFPHKSECKNARLEQALANAETEVRP